MYEIQIERVFCATHALRLPDGSYETIHGHNWAVTVVVESQQLDAMETVMDFHELEPLLDALLGTVHNKNLNEVEPFADSTGELVVNPTAERVAWWLAEAIAPQLPDAVKLQSVGVGEAPGCTAVYRPA